VQRGPGVITTRAATDKDLEVIVSTIQRTTSRRTALQTALAGLLAASTASMLPAITQAAPEPTSVQHGAVTVADLVDHAGLVAESKRLGAESHASLQAVIEADKLLEGLTDTQAHAVRAYEQALTDMSLAYQDYVVAEIARHFPGLSRAIWAVVFHLRDVEGSLPPGECCEPEV
jgi:hypothetical protein